VRNNIHVCPAMGGGWQVRRAGSLRALSRHKYLEDAMNAGHTRAMAEKNVLYCHKRDGTILMRLAYGVGL
jgi:hypothetical protein